MSRAVMLASFRGPASGDGIQAADGPVKGGGGLIQLLEPWARESGARWVFASQEGGMDRTGGRFRAVSLSSEIRGWHYDAISNSVLWPLFHRLPAWIDPDAVSLAAWDGYKAGCHAFAEAIAEEAPEGAIVAIHDYQLLLVPGMLSAFRPDLRVVYFHHIPFASPAEFEALPSAWRAEIAASLGSCVCGFQSVRWRAQFDEFCSAEGVRAATPFVAPVHPEVGRLHQRLEADEVYELRRRVREAVGCRKLIVRVDRADPMKNVLVGIQALDLLFVRCPELRGRVVFAHHLMPTRTSVPAYQRHLEEIRAAVRRTNEKWETSDWTPIDLNIADHREYGLALFAEYDLLLVNPIREGLNLVSHEGPAMNQRNGLVVLSREAGAYDALGRFVLGVDPTSVSETAAALEEGLTMGEAARAARAGRLGDLVRSLCADSWHDQVVEAARPPSGV